MKGRWFVGDDIPMNILSRLSTKTLHFFKLVSKDWFNLISERSFAKLQLKRSEPLSGFFFQQIFKFPDDVTDNIIRYSPEKIYYIPVAGEGETLCQSVLDFLPENVVILSLNNGLICCQTASSNSDPMIYVCNPLNKQWTSLMWPDVPRTCRVGLAFDPFQDFMDFKLILVEVVVIQTYREEVADEEGEYLFSFHIYSSKTHSWRMSATESFKCNNNLTNNRGVLVGENLYWQFDDACGVLMFDPHNELYYFVSEPIPLQEFTYTPNICLGESQGKLNCVMISEYGLQLWVLEDPFKSKWVLNFVASLDEWDMNLAVTTGWTAPSRVDILSFKDGVMLVHVAASLYLFDFGTGKTKKLCDVSTLGPNANMFYPIVVPYTMSLAPVE